MKLLPPQRLRPEDYAGVEEGLNGIFVTIIFGPLFAALKEAGIPVAEFVNAAGEDELRRALRRGDVVYSDGVFTGKLDARLGTYLRSIGAERDGRTGAWKLPAWVAPAWIKAEAALAERRARAVHDKVLFELERAKARAAGGATMIPRLPGVDDAIEAIEDGFARTAAETLGVRKRIPKAQREAIERRYQTDVRPYVADATAKFIDDLHAAVVENARAGYRFEGLVEEIEHVHGVSERKARFLARQETSLFMADYRRERFTDAGVRRYLWSTSHDIRVRPYAGNDKLAPYGDHRALDRREFYYEAKAPAEYMSRKQPSNPGEDFGCRCVDRAIIE